MSDDGRIAAGEHLSPSTEFKKGMTPWNKGIKHIKVQGSKHPHWKGGKPDCKDCGVKLKYYNTERCISCHLVSDKAKEHIAKIRPKKGQFSGDKHHNWQGGITSEDRKARIDFRRTIQKKILERDNFTCQICDQYSGNLQVDHIKSWKEYPELRFSEDNCRTLCMACHYYVTFKKKLPRGVVWGHNLNQGMTS